MSSRRPELAETMMMTMGITMKRLKFAIRNASTDTVLKSLLLKYITTSQCIVI